MIVEPLISGSSNYKEHQDCFKEKSMPVQEDDWGAGWERKENRLKYCSCLLCCFLLLKAVSCCSDVQVEHDLSCRPFSRI